MFHRVVVNVIHVTSVIVLIAHRVLPELGLPDAAAAVSLTAAALRLFAFARAKRRGDLRASHSPAA